MQKALSPLLQIGLCTLGCLYASSTQAQVTSDGTVNTQVNQNGNVAEITGGETRGSNLFHSFQDFSVGTGNEAFFDNANDISNIFSRVTGGNISNIDGLIRANGSASLFLINPAGIIFGENARLDVGGSFLGTTADSILFEDGEFSAVDNLQQPILTINAPIGLGFRDNPAPIENSSTASADFTDLNPAVTFDDNLFGIRVPDGKTFALAGGDITADGGGIVAVGGRIELGAIGESGTLGINFEGDNINFNFPDDLARANVSLINNAGFLVSGSGGGDIAITANNIDILEGSGLFAGIFEGSQLPNAQAGDITLNATENIRIASSTDNSSIVANQVGNLQAGNLLVGITTQGSAGNISFNSNTFEGNGNFIIGSVTSGAGNAGEINIDAEESVSLEGDSNNSSGILSLVGASAKGNGGDVIISTPSLSILDSGLLLTTIGDGNTGNLQIEASNSITVRGNSQFQSTSLGNGNAGNITIDAPNSNISFESSDTIVATIIASLEAFPGITPEIAETATTFFGIPTVSTGSSGDISITSRNLSITGGASLSTSTAGQATNENLSSDAGDIDISVSDSLVLSANSQLLSNTAGQGNAGDVNIIAGEKVSFQGSNNNSIANIRTTVEPLPDVLAEGFTQVRQGGNINITAKSVSLINGSRIESSTLSNGNAGDINILSNNIEVDGGVNGLLTGLFASVGSDATGQGGNIILGDEQSPIEQLGLNNGSQIVANTFGKGDAGNLSIFADNIDIRGSGDFASGLFAEVGENATGQGGNLNIGSEQSPVEQLEVTDDSQISVSVFGEGSAGNLSIFANNFELNKVENGIVPRLSQISANVREDAIGSGGNLFIDVDNLEVTGGGQISASTLGEGDAGLVNISANKILLDGEGSTGFNSGIFGTVEPSGTGNAGGINIKTTDLTISNGAEIDASTLGVGDGGNITIEANNTIQLDGMDRIEDGNGFRSNSGIFAQVETGASGDGGNVDITSGNLIVTNNAEINVGSESQGVGGSLFVNTDSLSLDSGSILSSTAFEQGGNIELAIAENLTLENSSVISAEASGNAVGGNVNINANFIVAFPNGDNDILANANQGRGGVISIDAKSLFGIEERPDDPLTNDIDASSQVKGLDGTVSISTPDINPVQGATELPVNVVEPEETVAQACRRDRLTESQSGLTIEGKGGIPAEPGLPLDSHNISVNGQANPQSTIPAPIETAQGKIQPARGVIVTESGEIILTAYRTNNAGDRLTEIKPNCS